MSADNRPIGWSICRPRVVVWSSADMSIDRLLTFCRYFTATCVLVTVACRHNLTWVCCLITTKFVAHHQKGSWGNAYNLYIWHWQSKLLSDIPPTVDRYSADKRWLAYRQASLDISTKISADSRLICRPWLGRYLGRYVDRHILVIISDERYVDRHIGHLH